MTRRSRRAAPPSWGALLCMFMLIAAVWLFQTGTLDGLFGTASLAAVEAPQQQDGAHVLAPASMLPIVPQPSAAARAAPSGPASVETDALRGYRGPWYQAYFTKPAYPEGPSDRRDGMDQALVADIERAQRRVELASFDLDLETVAAALIAAKQRGVEVRVSIDGENLETPEVAGVMGEIEAAGIGVFYDKRNAFMHDKIAVIDDRIVWTGSWNMTINDTFRNNNNMLRIENAGLAANYNAKLELIFDGGGGPGHASVVEFPKVRFGDVSVSSMFAPDDPITDMLVQQIDSAQERIDVLAFAFTSDPIAEALIAARERGVAVRVVMERRNLKGSGSEFPKLRDAGIDAHPDGNCYVMHHKVIVLDGQHTITGSFNFTGSAQDQNDENVLVIDDRSLAALYSAEFERIYDQALHPPRCAH